MTDRDRPTAPSDGLLASAIAAAARATDSQRAVASLVSAVVAAVGADRGAVFIWDGERLDHWLENPRTFLPGTKMSFAGISDSTDRRDVVAFLKVETGYSPPPARP